MNESNFEFPAESAGLLDLGVLLGQNHAFAIIAGRCSAAQAAGLFALREQRVYRACSPSWKEFCVNFLKISRGEADKLIRLWEQFGAGYFEVAQLTRISAETYGAIASSVHNGALHFNGEPIELVPQNCRKVAAAVAELRGALPARRPAKKKPPRPLEMHERIAELDKRCTAILEDFDDISRKERNGENWLKFTATLAHMHSRLARLALENGLV
jgi:hypothetical protein